uniref:Uncharacterized protein n=1 Tax=Romanomermis culicivorax TaxID=13658 RepID=A0A915HIY0_ROMCU
MTVQGKDGAHFQDSSFNGINFGVNFGRGRPGRETVQKSYQTNAKNDPNKIQVRRKGIATHPHDQAYLRTRISSEDSSELPDDTIVNEPRAGDLAPAAQIRAGRKGRHSGKAIIDNAIVQEPSSEDLSPSAQINIRRKGKQTEVVLRDDAIVQEPPQKEQSNENVISDLTAQEQQGRTQMRRISGQKSTRQLQMRRTVRPRITQRAQTRRAERQKITQRQQLQRTARPRATQRRQMRTTNRPRIATVPLSIPHAAGPVMSANEYYQYESKTLYEIVQQRSNVVCRSGEVMCGLPNARVYPERHTLGKCVEINSLCNDAVDCPGFDDENPMHCAFYRVLSNYIKQLNNTIDQIISNPRAYDNRQNIEENLIYNHSSISVVDLAIN